MKLVAQARKAVKRIVLGPGDLPQQCIIGMREPQQEIVVELHGLGAPLDVTNHHTLACAAPFTVGIALDGTLARALQATMRLSLHFRERSGSRQLLGKLGLQFSDMIPADDQSVCCFTARYSRNYCLPAIRIWAHYLHWAYLRRRQPPDVHLAARDVHAMPVFFICPRPVALVSVAHEETNNLFPMNLMGSLRNGYFGFALNSARAASALVKRAGRLALSSVPLEQARIVRDLGRNHKRAEGIRWNELPFPMTMSSKLRLPVPSFALRVREMEIVTVRDMGSHTFFVARILEDDQRTNGPQFFMVHGIYQAWRQKITGRNTLSKAESAIS